MAVSTVERIMRIIVKVRDEATKRLRKIHATVEGTNKETKKLNKTMDVTKGLFRKWLGLGLGMLFVGMALQKTFGTWLRTMYTEYIEIVGRTNEFTQSMGRLNAAWTYLKFTIIDTIQTSPLLMGFIKWAITFIDKMSVIMEKHGSLVIVLMVIAFVIGSIMLVFGQIFLFAIGIAAAMGIGILPALIFIFGIIIYILEFVWIMYEIWNSDMPMALKKVYTAIVLLAGPLFVIYITYLVIYKLIKWAAEKLGLWEPIVNGISFAFKKVKDFVMWIVRGIKWLLDKIGLLEPFMGLFGGLFSPTVAAPEVSPAAKGMGEAPTFEQFNIENFYLEGTPRAMEELKADLSDIPNIDRFVSSTR